MRLEREAHTSQPWRIHAIAGGLGLEDVWEVPGVVLAEDEMGAFVATVAGRDPAATGNVLVRALFALRWRLGELLGWDEEADGVGARVASLRERVPAELRPASEPVPSALPFSTLYLTHDEWAAETANATVHGVLHLGRRPDGHVQLAVLVRPNGLLGRAYMAAIKPFRYALVYPVMLREIARAWRAR